MAHVRIYDPVQCCSSGVCGPDVDASVANFSDLLDTAMRAGVIVDRFSLGQEPGEYVNNAVVKGFLTSEGVGVLPIVFVDDEVVSKGGYPDHAELTARLGLTDQRAPAKSSQSCCSPPAAVSGCCA